MTADDIQGKPSSPRQHILLVEDEALIAMTERMELEKYGYAVRTVTTGEKAVEAAKTSSGIDLILMDINLGDGIDGTEAAAIILEDHDIPIVFLSSHTEPEIVEKTEKITSYGYVVKNSSVTVLDASIKMAFRLFEANQRVTNELVERKWAEEKIQEMDVHMRKLFTNVPELVYQFTRRPDGSYYVPIASDGIRNVFGCSPEDVRDNFEPISRVIHPEDAARVIEDIEYSAKHLSYFACEFRVHIPGRDVQWILSRSTPEKLPDGSVTWYGFSANITKRKQDEEELRQSEQKYKILFNEMLDGFALHEIICDLSGAPVDYRFLDVNPAFEGITGLKATDIVGRTVLDVLPGIDQHWIDVYGRVALSGKSVSFEHYATPLAKHFKVTAFWVATGQFACAFQDLTGRKQAEEERHRSEIRWDSLVRTIPDYIAIHDLENNFLYLNRYAEGFREEDVIGTNAYSYMPSESAELFMSKSRLCAQSGKTQSFGHSAQGEMGNIRHYDNYIIPIMEHGVCMNLLVISRDITQRKQFEQELVMQNEYLEAILETTADGFWVVSPETKITNVNAAYCRMTGYTADELKSMAINDLDATESPQESTERVKRIMENGSGTFETRHRRKDGSLLDVEVAASRLDRPDGMYLVAFCRDISERKQAEGTLFESERRYRSVEKAAELGIWEMDIATGESFWSDEFFRICGYVPGSIVPNSDTGFSIIHDDDKDRAAQAVTETIETGKPYSIEKRIVRPDGGTRWVHSIGEVELDENGTAKTLVGSFQDITERKLAQEEIRKQLSEKETLLREVHHRVKNNIGTIESFLSLRIGELDIPEAKATLQDAVSRVRSMRVLYEKLLLDKNLREVSIKDYAESLLDSLLMVFDPQRNITVETHIADFEVASKKAVSIGIMINELLTNVFKYAFKDRESGTVSVSIDNEENHVTLVIQDDGVGVDERVMEDKSPGLGLTIVRMLAEQLEGTYSIANDNGARSVLQLKI